MGITKRCFVLSAAGLLLQATGIASGKVLSLAPLDELPPIPGKFSSLSDEPPMNDGFGDVLVRQGTGAPDEEEIKKANEIISAAPTNCDPLEVAAFFLNVARGGFANDWRSYTRAWPRDAPAN